MGNASSFSYFVLCVVENWELENVKAPIGIYKLNNYFYYLFIKRRKTNW